MGTVISLVPLRNQDDDIQYQISLLEPWPTTGRTTIQSKIVDAQACCHCVLMKRVKRLELRLTVPTASPSKFTMTVAQLPPTERLPLPAASVTVDQYYAEAF